jgi:hypothetical protein
VAALLFVEEGCIAITQIAALFSPPPGSLPAEEHQDQGPVVFAVAKDGGRGDSRRLHAGRTGMFRGRARLPLVSLRGGLNG